MTAGHGRNLMKALTSPPAVLMMGVKRRWNVVRRTTMTGLSCAFLTFAVDVGSTASATTNHTTLQFFARGTEPQTTTPAGAILSGRGTQVAGDYLIDTYKLYGGTKDRHAAD